MAKTKKTNEKQKNVIATLRHYGNQKRLTVPKQEETEDWEDLDRIKLEKVEE